MPCCIKLIHWYILALLSVCWGARWGGGLCQQHRFYNACVRADMSKRHFGHRQEGPREFSCSIHRLLLDSSIWEKKQYFSWFSTSFFYPLKTLNSPLEMTTVYVYRCHRHKCERWQDVKSYTAPYILHVGNNTTTDVLTKGERCTDTAKTPKPKIMYWLCSQAVYTQD